MPSFVFDGCAFLVRSAFNAESPTSGQVRLVTPHAMSNHVFNANLYAPPGRTYEIDGSTNLVNWSFAAGGS